jgi:AcrR family transcriptional regulator
MGRRASNEQATRRALQTAALELAEAQGIATTTIDQIAARAGVSRRTFFRYFASKEDAAIGDHTERFNSMATLLDAPRGNHSAVEHCLACAQAVLEPVWSDAELYRKRYRTIRSDPLLRDQTRITDAEFEALVVAAVRSDFARDHADVHARMFAAAGMAAVNAVLDQWSQRTRYNARHELAAAFNDLGVAAQRWRRSDS